MLGPVIDKLRSAIGELVAGIAALVSADDVPWVELRRDLVALEQLREQLEHGIGSLVASCDARGASALDGDRSMADLLTKRTGQSRAATGARCWLATRLRSMPATDAALGAGEITASHARVLTRAQNARTMDAFARDEEILVGAAKNLTADQLAKVVAHWLRHVDTDGSAPDPEGVRDVFHLSMTSEGRLKGNLDLGGEAAIRFKAVLDEATDSLWRREKAARDVDPTDPRADHTRSQRRARALVELLDRGAAAPDSPNRRRPLFTITTTLPTLTRTGDPLDWRTEVDLAWRSAIPGPLVDKMMCDCSVGRVLLDADSEPLDVGRTKRLATEAQRRALLAKYGGCGVDGCDAPASQVEIHHVVEWTDEGLTDIENLLPACNWHHHRIHDGSIVVERGAGGFEFRLPDGRLLADPRAGPDASAA